MMTLSSPLPFRLLIFDRRPPDAPSLTCTQLSLICLPPPDFNAARDLHFACHCKALQYFFFANRPSTQSRIIQSMRPCALHASFQKAYVLALTHGSSSGRRAEKWTKKNQARLWQPRHGVYIKKGKNDVCDRVFSGHLKRHHAAIFNFLAVAAPRGILRACRT
jgi:hypothetical protein